MARKINFVDGVEQSAKHPSTFEVPTAEEKLAVKSGTFVKIGVLTGFDKARPSAERFWLKVDWNVPERQVVVGRVDNDLVCTDGHGLKYKDVIEVPYNAILTILPE
ncbi:hypothetical protein [Pseudomonas sp. P8_250]|uniref:hypothetical protein n=1 Tax=Pseudomonas sp. P8_250 TaxID=3043446 RepID=UPI002A365A05|nr:hypothetical protein [Pseudomonas sp. P8_250]MDX9668726.1 hypothetical protein [Pseudomonas sp. P8_250]